MGSADEPRLSKISSLSFLPFSSLTVRQVSCVRTRRIPACAGQPHRTGGFYNTPGVYPRVRGIAACIAHQRNTAGLGDLAVAHQLPSSKYLQRCGMSVKKPCFLRQCQLGPACVHSTHSRRSSSSRARASVSRSIGQLPRRGPAIQCKHGVGRCVRL